MRVAVLTPTLPERSQLLAECRESVAAQTVPVDHRVGIDTADTRAMAQAVNIMNQLGQESDADWLVALADDDLIDPEFADVLLDQSCGADIVYPWCRVQGSDWCPNRLFNPAALRRQNFIPATAMIRRDLWLDLGGWTPGEYEDWDFWKRALDRGARFRCVPEVLWTYRMEGQNLFNRGKG